MARLFKSMATSIPVLREVAPLRSFRREFLLQGNSVGLVPTMGALHQGHLALIRRAAAENNAVFVSIYVNPTQFGVTEDLSTYPRTWEADMSALHELDRELAGKEGGRISAVFAPTASTMYPTLPPAQTLDGNGTFVTITPLSSLLEGGSRPTFFRGVATVCTKLFNLVTPERVYFGQKDIQQTVIIRRLVKDLCIDTEVVVVPTVRDPDGLAMSSRNAYLGPERRQAGLALSRALFAAEAAFKAGRRGSEEVLGPAMDVILNAPGATATAGPGYELDYLTLVNGETLEKVESIDKGAIICGAIKMQPFAEDCLGGGLNPVRLIDNLILGEI